MREGESNEGRIQWVGWVEKRRGDGRTARKILEGVRRERNGRLEGSRQQRVVWCRLTNDRKGRRIVGSWVIWRRNGKAGGEHIRTRRTRVVGSETVKKRIRRTEHRVKGVRRNGRLARRTHMSKASKLHIRREGEAKGSKGRRIMRKQTRVKVATVGSVSSQAHNGCKQKAKRRR